MNKRTLLNLALMAVAVALGLVVYFRPGRHSHSKPAIHITDLKSEQIRTIRVDYQQNPQVELVRKGAHWGVTKPLQARANEGLIRSVLAAANETADSSYKTSSLKLAKFGLAKPKLKVWLNDTEIDFGDTNPLGGKRYIRVAHHVFVVDDSLYDQLATHPVSYVSERLLPEGAAITRIATPDLTVSQDKQGQWHADPKPKNLAKGAIQDLVDSWSNAYAQSVDKAGHGPAQKAVGTVTVRLKGHKRPVKFEILKSARYFVLERPAHGLVYQLGGDRRHDLLKLKTQAPKQSASSKGQGSGKPKVQGPAPKSAQGSSGQ